MPYRVKRGTGTSPEEMGVGPPAEAGYVFLAHTHPGNRLLHRFPSGGDISSAQVPPNVGSGEIFVFRYPGHPRGERGPIIRTRYEVVGFGEPGMHARITPDHPRDFDEALALIEELGFVQWIDPSRTTLAIAPQRQVYPDQWFGGLAVGGYNDVYGLLRLTPII